jgi:DNA mismatch endonuclease (patch repair protein)
MQANRRRDTGPERRLRSLLHRAGLRFRVDYRVGQGKGAPRPDIAFLAPRVAVFVDGCFWHGCPDHGGSPSKNISYWGPKLARNRARDLENDRALREAGWEVLRVWEHEPADEAADRVIDAVSRKRAKA